jgi:hypothetical protein
MLPQYVVDVLADGLAKGRHDLLASVLSPRLEQIVTGEQAVENHWHPLGFLTIVLGKSTRREKISLHVWPQEERRTQDPPWLVHRHVWHLVSHVLAGSVTNLYYDVKSAPADSAGLHRLYYVHPANDEVSVILATANLVTCDRAQVENIGAGTTYEVPVNRFHTTVSPEATFAATLIATGTYLREKSDVVGDLDGLPRYEYRRVGVEPEILSRNLEQLVRTL